MTTLMFQKTILSNVFLFNYIILACLDIRYDRLWQHKGDSAVEKYCKSLELENEVK